MLASRSQLGDLMKTLNLPMHAAELGVAEGRYALDMMDWGMKCLYLVDLWQHVDGMRAELGDPAWDHEEKYRDCMKKLQSYTDGVVVLRGWAHEMAKEIPDSSLGMVYEDATHEDEWVTKHLHAYCPKLVPGGIYACHDYSNPGLTVKAAVDRFAASLGVEVHVIPENGPNDASAYFITPE